MKLFSKLFETKEEPRRKISGMPTIDQRDAWFNENLRRIANEKKLDLENYEKN